MEKSLEKMEFIYMDFHTLWLWIIKNILVLLMWFDGDIKNED